MSKLVKLNPFMIISKFDDANCNSHSICEVTDINDGIRRFTLPSWFINQFEYSHELELSKVISSLEYNGSTDDAASKIEYLLENKIIVNKDDNCFVSPKSTIKSKLFRFNLDILNNVTTNRISQFFVLFFSKIILVISLFLACVGQFLFYYYVYGNAPLFFTEIRISEKLFTLLLLFGGLFFHETGHASAAYKYGCRNVKIGVGVYICFVVFYAELSECWKNSRKERAIINAGGIYFQALYTFILTVIYLVVEMPSLYYAILILNFSLLWNFNPFLRLDGYWMASDILGVANLRSVSRSMLYFLVLRLFNKRSVSLKGIKLLSANRSKYLAIYSLASFGFLIFLFIIFFDRVFVEMVVSIPRQFEQIKFAAIFNDSIYSILPHYTSLIWDLLVACFMLYFMFYSLVRTLHFVKNVYKLST